tara:strand:+ start:332 stop:997 length:666 start_codon:yes stop_codon:yes gene_type:complete
MFRILSFVILIAIVLWLIYGFSSTNNKQMSDTHDIATGYAINNLFVIETEDDVENFSGFAHSFYLYVSSPYENETSIIKRGDDDDDFNIKLNNHNILTVYMGNANSIEYMMPLGKWTHVVVNVNPHALELYIDGSLLKSNINSRGHDSDDYYGNNISIGDSSAGLRNGWIASYKYYDSPLSSDKINTMYQENLNKYSKLKDQYGVLVTFNKNEQELARYTL